MREKAAMATYLSIPKSKTINLSIFTWIVVLLVSDLPNAIWQAVLGEPPAWLFWLKIGLLLALVAAGMLWKPLHTVSTYFFLLLVLMLALWGMNWLRGTSSYLQWEQSVNWVIAMAGYQLLKLAVVLVMVAVLLLLGRRWKEFYLTPGQLRASIKPIKGDEKQGTRSLSWSFRTHPRSMYRTARPALFWLR